MQRLKQPSSRTPRAGPVTPVVIGTSYRNSPIMYRERLARLLRDQTWLDGVNVDEWVSLETCSRIELVIASTTPGEAAEEIVGGWAAELGEARFYVKQGGEAISHLFTVASGLDSIAPGEEQILQQIKGAAKRSRLAGTSRGILSPLFDAAVGAGVRVRAAAPGQGDSLPSLGLELALRTLGREPEDILLIGTGRVARIVAGRLVGRRLGVASKRGSLPGGFEGAHLVRWSELESAAARAELIVSASNHEGYVLRPENLPDGRRRVILDLSFPRNIDPSFRRSSTTRLIDLDDLARQTGSWSRDGEALRLVEEEAESFERWLNATRVDPTLSEVFRLMEAMRRDETALALRRLGNLSPRQRKVIEAMGRRITSKVLAGTVRYAKAEGLKSQRERLETLRAIFIEGEG